MGNVFRSGVLLAASREPLAESGVEEHIPDRSAPPCQEPFVFTVS